MRHTVVACVVVVALAGSSPSGADERGPRTPLRVRDSASGCPGVSGAFVALLDPERGMLLLSGAAFPGGREGPAPVGGPVHVGTWSMDEVSAPSGAGSLWWASYPFPGKPGIGCVAFDRDRFSAEGDLVTYLRWVVEKVYFQLPAEERSRFPAFTLANRRVSLRVEQEGYAPLRLEGREGATLAFRVAGTGSNCFLLPLVLDPVSGRLAIRVARVGPDAFAPSEADWYAVVVANAGERLTLPDLPALLVVEGVHAD